MQGKLDTKTGLTDAYEQDEQSRGKQIGKSCCAENVCVILAEWPVLRG